MSAQSIEVEARAYVEQYRGEDGRYGNYRTDLIAGLLDALAERRAEINQARAKVSELAVKLAEARRHGAERAFEAREAAYGVAAVLAADGQTGIELSRRLLALAAQKPWSNT